MKTVIVKGPRNTNGNLKFNQFSQTHILLAVLPLEQFLSLLCIPYYIRLNWKRVFLHWKTRETTTTHLETCPFTSWKSQTYRCTGCLQGSLAKKLPYPTGLTSIFPSRGQGRYLMHV